MYHNTLLLFMSLNKLVLTVFSIKTWGIIATTVDMFCIFYSFNTSILEKEKLLEKKTKLFSLFLEILFSLKCGKNSIKICKKSGSLNWFFKNLISFQMYDSERLPKKKKFLRCFFVLFCFNYYLLLLSFFLKNFYFQFYFKKG